MPTWSNQLPKLQKHMGFDLRRTPQVSPLRAIVTSDDILVCDTHFFHGRTIPCERAVTDVDGQLTSGNCPACREAMPYRTHAYVSAFDAKTREHFLFECTAMAAKAFVEYRDANGTLHGCGFSATRPKGLKNSKICIETTPINLAKVHIPEPPDLIKALSVIWRLPAPAIEVEQLSHRSPSVSIQQAPLDRMRNQPDNVPDPPTVGDILKPNGKVKVFA